MGKVSKSTKKFQSKHLKRTLDHRKELKKHGQKIKGRRGNKSIDQKQDIAGTKEEQILKKSVKEEVFRDLSVEKLFNSDFDLPFDKASVKNTSNKIVESEDESDDDMKEYLNGEASDDIPKPIERQKAKTPRVIVKDLKKLKNADDYVTVLQSFTSSNASRKFSTEEFVDNLIEKFPFKMDNKKECRVIRDNEDNRKLIGDIKPLLKHLVDGLNSEDEDFMNVLQQAYKLFPFFLRHPEDKIIKKIFSTLLNKIIDSDAATAEIQIFIKSVLIEFKGKTLKTFLRIGYSKFIKHCSKYNFKTRTKIELFKEILIELFTIDELLSYEIGYEYVKQLALHLKTTIDNDKGDDNKIYLKIYNWQFVQALMFWSRVIAEINEQESEVPNDKNKINELIHPLIQVQFGTIKLIPTVQFFALRFQLLESLIQILEVSKVFIPITPYLFEVLSSPLFQRQISKRQDVEFDIDTSLKCNQDIINTEVYQSIIIKKFLSQFKRIIKIYETNIIFPEFFLPIFRYIENFITRHQDDSNLTDFCLNLERIMSKLKENSKFIDNKRSQINFSPDNRIEANKFLQ